MSEDRLIPPTMLYRFALPCLKTGEKWKAKKGVQLSEDYRLPSFSALDGRVPFADVRCAWSEEGMFFNVDVLEKQQSIWCRETQLMESDGFQVWIDTRNTHNVHRATRFCHWFLFLPTGGGSKRNDPVGTMLRINRSKEDPKTLNQVPPKVSSTVRHGGYSLSVFIPSMALAGWNPDEHRELGFHFEVVDRERGNQSLAIGSEFPASEDPSLWQTLQLVS